MSDNLTRQAPFFKNVLTKSPIDFQVPEVSRNQTRKNVLTIILTLKRTTAGFIICLVTLPFQDASNNPKIKTQYIGAIERLRPHHSRVGIIH